jgi:hypothetical protein
VPRYRGCWKVLFAFWRDALTPRLNEMNEWQVAGEGQKGPACQRLVGEKHALIVWMWILLPVSQIALALPMEISIKGRARPVAKAFCQPRSPDPPR